MSTNEVKSQVSHLETLKTFIRQERDARQVKKALAVKLVYQGHTYESITQILDVSLGSISDWKMAYESKGLEGFKPQHQGRKSYLSEAQRAEVIGWLQAKKIWTLNELEHHLASTYDVVYESKQSYYELFECADISWKKTSKVNPKADDEVVAAKKQRLNKSWNATALR
jgi:putative transposase